MIEVFRCSLEHSGVMYSIICPVCGEVVFRSPFINDCDNHELTHCPNCHYPVEGARKNIFIHIFQDP